MNQQKGEKDCTNDFMINLQKSYIAELGFMSNKTPTLSVGVIKDEYLGIVFLISPQQHVMGTG